jgi:uncharacterized zinc-type alcohol dehydrogenase-like protein
MREAKGYAVLSKSKPLEPFNFSRRAIGARDVGFEILFSGICHSDIHQAREEWGPSIFPMVPGHEIVGRVTQVGAEVTKFKDGDLIGVGVFVDSCGNCDNCNRGMEHFCREGMTGTYNSLERDGKTIAFGGYSNYFVINERYAVSIPSNLDLAGVAPLLCAGITLYSPIRHWNVSEKSRVGIIGLGGLGHMGVKFAAALGAEVTVFSHSQGKMDDALKFGAKKFVNTDQEEWHKPLRKKFDLILNTVSAEIDLDPYLQCLDTDGTLVIIGLPGKPYAVHAGSLLDGRRSIAGSMIGGMPELQEMMNFCGENQITSQVELIGANYINEAYERTIKSDVKYRFVIDASTF